MRKRSATAPVIEALEHIAAHRQSRETRRQLFTAIANCGFPEAHHNATALAICETFARQARFEWASSLALGGSEMMGGFGWRQRAKSDGAQKLLRRQPYAVGSE